MSWVQTLIFILLILGPAAAQIFQKAREKQQIQKTNKRREAMRVEALRTGRPVVEDGQSGGEPSRGNEAAKMASLERDRQARLAALRDQARQRALSRQSQQSGASASGGPAQSSLGVSSQEETAARRASEARAVRQQAALEQQRERQRQMQRRQEVERQRAQRRQQTQSPRSGQTRQQAQTQPTRQTQQAGGSIQGLTDSQRRHRKEEAQASARHRAEMARLERDRASAKHVAEWLRNKTTLRHAIVLNEVLGKPLALRR